MNKDVNPTISDTELERSYWFVTHYHTLRLVLIGALSVISALLFGSVVVGVLSIYLFSSETTAAFANQITEQKATLPIQLQPIAVLRSGSVESGEAIRDAFIVVANRNDEWYARAELVIKGSSGEELTRKKIMLLPGQERSFVSLGLPESSSRSITAVFENIRYAHMSERDHELERDKKNIVVSDVRFIPASESGTTRLIPITKLRFSVINQTTSSFWEVRIPIIMKSGSRIQALHEAVFSQLKAGQQKEVEVSWYAAINEGDSFDIQPFIDILDTASYQQ